MSRLLTVVALTCLGAATAHAQGDTLDMRGTDNMARIQESGKPTRGMSQARVESVYGAPQSREAAVGEPPISSWHYADFVVYFEFDKVIHAVSKG